MIYQLTLRNSQIDINYLILDMHYWSISVNKGFFLYQNKNKKVDQRINDKDSQTYSKKNKIHKPNILIILFEYDIKLTYVSDS